MGGRVMLSRLLLARSIKNHSSNDNSWNDFMGLLAPIAWYKLNEASGPDAVDSSGNGRTATYPGSGITYNQPSGMSNIGDGVTHTVGTPSPTQRAYDPAFGITGDVTILAVTKIAATHTTYPIIVTQPSDTTLSGRSTFLLHQDYGSLNGKFTFRINVGGAYNDVSSSTIPVVGNTYLVVGRRKGTDLSIFVNGVKENTLSGVSGLADTAAYPLYIGGTVENNSGNGSVISNVAIFNRALYDEDIIALYTAANGALGDPYWENVIALLHLDEANGSVNVVDSSGLTTWNTMLAPASITTAISKFGTACLYNPTGPGLHSLGNASSAFGTGDFTIEFFIFKPAALASGDSYGRLFQQGGNAAQGGIYLANSVTSNPLNAFLQLNWAGAYVNLPGAIAVTISNDSWHHIAITRQSGTWRFFLDGTQQWVSNYTGNGNDITGQYYGFGANAQLGERLGAYFDEIRITKGVARYTSNFTAPTMPFPNHT